MYSEPGSNVCSLSPRRLGVVRPATASAGAPRRRRRLRRCRLSSPGACSTLKMPCLLLYEGGIPCKPGPGRPGAVPPAASSGSAPRRPWRPAHRPCFPAPPAGGSRLQQPAAERQAVPAFWRGSLWRNGHCTAAGRRSAPPRGACTSGHAHGWRAPGPSPSPARSTERWAGNSSAAG